MACLALMKTACILWQIRMNSGEKQLKVFKDIDYCISGVRITVRSCKEGNQIVEKGGSREQASYNVAAC